MVGPSSVAEAIVPIKNRQCPGFDGTWCKATRSQMEVRTFRDFSSACPVPPRSVSARVAAL